MKKKTRKTAKQKKSELFLCILMASIVLFVSSVCLFIGKRNQKLQSAATESAVNESVEDTVNSEPATEKESEKETTEKAKETTEKTTAEQTTAAPTTEKSTKSAVSKIKNPKIISIDQNKWYLTLVNSGYRIPDDYKPDLVTVCGSSEQLDKKVASHYEEMYNAALQDGVTLTPCSGYRSYELQERNYNNKTAYYESLGYSHNDALVKAATIIMPPGSSEHNLGYAMDIVCVDTWFEDTEEFTWLNEHAADYGFILRYPADKTDITNVTYEPWHWRYVGVEDAQKMKESGLVLEEYLGVK